MFLYTKRNLGKNQPKYLLVVCDDLNKNGGEIIKILFDRRFVV